MTSLPPAGALGPGRAADVGAAWAPGRCTILGEHVDYAGGRVLCCALDIGVAVALAPSDDGNWSVRSGDVVVRRSTSNGSRHGDIGDRVLAAAEVARREGIASPPLDIALAASLPPGAGLSSSAAVICATIGAILARAGARLAADRLAELAWVAEHDIVGVPCGRLDQRALVAPARDAVLLLDLADDSSVSVHWPWDDVALVVADSGERHDVGGREYAALRTGAEEVLREAGVVHAGRLTRDRVDGLPEPLRPRAEHLLGEGDRVRAALVALDEADAPGLGRLMSAAHRAQRDLLCSTTSTTDAMVMAAEATPGCFGARLAGAGFGGSVVALCRERDAGAAAAAMAAAAGSPSGTWVTRPAAGLAELSPGLFTGTTPGGSVRPGRTLRGR